MAADVKVDFEEAHFTSLPSQTNIYGLAKITKIPETSKVLVASLNGRVTCVEYPNKWENPLVHQLPFTYIPAGDAEIVSIDAFVRPSTKSCGLVVGVSLILLNIQHNSLSNQKQFLNIYSSVEKGKENCLESIAEGCQLIELNFVPFQLCHAEIKNKGTIETVFLLGGSDHRIHMFREVLDKTHQTFEEQPTEAFFPELQDLPSNVVWLDIQHIADDKRLTAIGCLNGFVQVSLVDHTDEPKVVQTWHVEHDGPITSVKLFTLNAEHKTAQGLETLCTSEENDLVGCHLLVCCATEPCVMYMDVINQGLAHIVVLPDSDKFDCVLCMCIADVDWDGRNELLLGTYGQELLIYKFTSTDDRSELLDMQVMWRRSFSSPLFAIEYLDMTGDGLREVVVASLLGLHVLQHNLDDAGRFFSTKMKRFLESSEDQK